MMKRYIQKLIIATLVIVPMIFASCDKWLDLRPESEIILDEFWQSEGDVEQVLASCYRGLTEQDVIYRMMAWGELRSDNIINGSGFPNARYDLQKMLENDITSTNAYANWGSFYAVINYCNNLLYYAPFVVDRDANFTAADLNRIKAEAWSIRALAYFYLVRTFRDVPLYTEPSIDDTQDYNKPKSSEAEVLDSIVSDLMMAKQYIRNDFGNINFNKGRFTLDAVNALLADVYLWRQDYELCSLTCDEILSGLSTTKKLVKGDFLLSQVFYAGNSSESIFELQFDDNGMINSAVQILYGYSGDPFGELSLPATLAHNVEDNLVGLYSPFVFKVNESFSESKKDIRAKISYRHSGGKYFVFKYAGVSRVESLSGVPTYRYRSNTSNWIIYRLADVYLMQAEALAQMNKNLTNPLITNQIFNLLNKTYMRSNEETDSLKASLYTNQAEIEKLVLRERQREFLFEGKRWFDLVRLARREGSVGTLSDYVRTKNPGSTANLSPTVPDAMFMPIALREIEANKNLKQNPFYEEESGSSTR